MRKQLYVPERGPGHETWTEAEAVAVAEGISMSRLTTDALEAYLKKWRRTATARQLAAAKRGEVGS